MPTCVQTINAVGINGIEPIFPNTVTNMAFSAQNKQLFLMDTAKQETVVFNVSISSSQATNLGVTINIYEVRNTLIHLRTVVVADLNTSFQKDMTARKYIICVGSSVYSFTGTIVAVFSRFQVYTKLKLDCYSGCSTSLDMSVPLPERECNKLMFFEIVDRSLPPGLEMTALGNIEGVLPNLDCIEDDKDLSPSQNWYYNIENQWVPWGRQWRFKVRVYLFDVPDTFAEKWFCIKIHNNWSWDKDNFKPPFETEQSEVIIEDVLPLKSECCEETVEIPQQTLTPIVSDCGCDDQQGQETVQFLKWYYRNLLVPDDSPDIVAFIESFKKTDYYKTMTNFINDEWNETKEKEMVLKEIARIEREMILGRSVSDIDYIMMQMKDEENQKLPITVEAFNGLTFEIEVV